MSLNINHDRNIMVNELKKYFKREFHDGLYNMPSGSISRLFDELNARPIMKKEIDLVAIRGNSPE